MPLIKCENVALKYQSHTVCDNINFTVNDGDYLCIVGENGSGKSTLLKGILGLLPLKSGNIAFGTSLCRTDIGYLPQQTSEQQDFPAKVKEVVLSGCLNKKRFLPFFTKADRELAQKNLERLGISDIANKSYRELSGGQQQRVLLARALCSASSLLLLDEPVTGLDPVVSSDFYKLIKQLNAELGIAVIMVSHDISRAVKNADKILHLGDTQTVFFGSTKDYLQSETGKNFAKAKEGDRV